MDWQGRRVLVTGGAGAGPVGYLRTATPTAGTDTMDTYESPRGGGPIVRGKGAYVVRSLQRVIGARWELSDTWYDSSGKETARQTTRTARASLAIEVELVRARGDSASLLITADHATAWIVPQGQAPHLFDGPANGERFATTVVTIAIAKSHPPLGAVFLAPQHTLYGADPLAVRVDSLRVDRHETLYVGPTSRSALVIVRPGGEEIWVDEVTGAELLSRGNAGPGRWWWHIRRGITPPTVR